MDSIFPIVSENLVYKNKADLEFPFLDYGFLYGYGLFESIRVSASRPQLLTEHVDRLRKASVYLDIPFEYSLDELQCHVLDLVQKNSVDNAILNIYLTPGNRGEDPALSNIEDAFLLMVLRKWPNYQPEQRLVLDLREQSFQRTPLDRLKTLAWMKNVLENRLSEESDDVILYDSNQRVLEATRSNVFFVHGNTLITPKSSVILEGVMRSFVLRQAEGLGFDCQIRDVYLDEIEGFDEVFLTNSLRGVCCVESISGISNISSGPVVLKLQKAVFLFLNSSEI